MGPLLPLTELPSHRFAHPVTDIHSSAGRRTLPLRRPESLDEERLISMELVSAIVEAEDGVLDNSLRVDEDSWREGESLLTLNVGVAW
ncbi:hypothetical protein NUW54_g14539 [Trametes sanguinea]|uniref:Uncharacterized protein n=1 Tax=Trametes sanguinea TaxID=158606 RepID=A0ACC1MC42_9APHY|nr:hypothetical protein NUW54_g14539 [Trametes sanguinea]